jgi:hypothetical protein
MIESIVNRRLDTKDAHLEIVPKEMTKSMIKSNDLNSSTHKSYSTPLKKDHKEKNEENVLGEEEKLKVINHLSLIVSLQVYSSSSNF